jgi:hypothetical protein
MDRSTMQTLGEEMLRRIGEKWIAESNSGVVEKRTPIDEYDSAQGLCNCGAAKGERHSDGCNTLSRLAQLGML